MEQGDVSSQSVLTWGIVSIIFAESGLVGLILAIIARGKAKKFVANGNELAGKAKVGNILSIVALILSIVMTVFWVFYFLMIVFAAASYM